MRQKKRKLEDFEQSDSTQSAGVKKMRINPHEPGSSGQSTGRYHRLCKQIACGEGPHPEHHTLPPLAVKKNVS